MKIRKIKKEMKEFYGKKEARKLLDTIEREGIKKFKPIFFHEDEMIIEAFEVDIWRRVSIFCSHTLIYQFSDLFYEN